MNLPPDEKESNRHLENRSRNSFEAVYGVRLVICYQIYALIQHEDLVSRPFTAPTGFHTLRLDRPINFYDGSRQAELTTDLHGCSMWRSNPEYFLASKVWPPKVRQKVEYDRERHGRNENVYLNSFEFIYLFLVYLRPYKYH